MRKNAVWLLLCLSLLLHTIDSGVSLFVKPRSITLYDKYGYKPVTVDREDLADMLRAGRWQDLEKGEIYVLQEIGRRAMSREYADNAVSNFGRFAPIIVTLKQRNLIQLENDVWMLTDRGKHVADVPE